MYTYRSDILKRVSESKGVSSSSVDCAWATAALCTFFSSGSPVSLFSGVMSSSSSLSSAKEFVQQAPKEISGRLTDLYGVVQEAVGKEKDKMTQRMDSVSSSIKETVGGTAREVSKRFTWQSSGGKEEEGPLSKFKMAAKKTLALRQQSRLNLNEHIKK